MLILIKYWRTLVPFIIIVVGLAGFHFWLSARLEQEKNEAIALINQQTKEKILNDKIEVVEAFKPSPAIESAVDVMLSNDSENSNGGGLLGTGKSTRTTERNTTSVDLGASNELSDKELDFIANNPELLQ